MYVAGLTQNLRGIELWRVRAGAQDLGLWRVLAGAQDLGVEKIKRTLKSGCAQVMQDDVVVDRKCTRCWCSTECVNVI